MERGTAGFLGGIIGGFIKLVIDQISIFMNLSSSSIVYTISSLLFGAREIYPLVGWITYILFAGFLGFIISKIITGVWVNFIYWGTIAGITIWALTSGISWLVGMTDPTWSFTLATTIVNFFSHLVLGIIITYAISLSKAEKTH